MDLLEGYSSRRVFVGLFHALVLRAGLWVALVANYLWEALPPVDLWAICLEHAIAAVGQEIESATNNAWEQKERKIDDDGDRMQGSGYKCSCLSGGPCKETEGGENGKMILFECLNLEPKILRECVPRGRHPR